MAHGLRCFGLTRILGFVCALLLITQAQADVQTVNVVVVGGQSTNTFVVFSRNVGTDQGCQGVRLVLPSSVMDADLQRRFYASMLAALATGTSVTISISTCYGTYPSMVGTDSWFLGQGG